MTKPSYGTRTRRRKYQVKKAKKELRIDIQVSFYGQLTTDKPGVSDEHFSTEVTGDRTVSESDSAVHTSTTSSHSSGYNLLADKEP